MAKIPLSAYTLFRAFPVLCQAITAHGNLQNAVQIVKQNTDKHLTTEGLTFYFMTADFMVSMNNDQINDDAHIWTTLAFTFDGYKRKLELIPRSRGTIWGTNTAA